MRNDLKTEVFRIDSGSGPYTVAILYNNRWHETVLLGTLDEVIDAAQDAARRSRLTVQVRDDDGSVVEEINADSARSRGESVHCTV